MDNLKAHLIHFGYKCSVCKPDTLVLLVIMLMHAVKVVFILGVISVVRRMVETLPSLIIKVLVVVEVLVREILPR